MAFASDSMEVKVLEKSQIAPPLASVPTTSLPLTFFDVCWLTFPPVKRLLFFHFNNSNHHFTQTVLPNIKQSLSLALQHFYPLAGHLRQPLHDYNKPDIFYADGDSVTLTVAESEYSDFDHLAGHQPRDAKLFNPLVPALESKPTDQLLSPLMAVQVTLFPNSGISIGITFRHAVADGKIFNQFFKFWASICKLLGSKETPLIFESSLPFYDRTVIKDTFGICEAYLKQLQQLAKAVESFRNINSPVPASPLIDVVRATFVLGRKEIERIKQWVLSRLNEKYKNRATASGVSSFHLSTFVIACAYVWVCLVNARKDEVDHMDDNNQKGRERESFTFSVDCRDRLDPPIPELYFGNCLQGGVVELNKSDLIGEDGIVIAAEEIGRMVQRVNSECVMERAKTFLNDIIGRMTSGVRLGTVAGSPKFKVYETDFGWGRPKKVEVVSIEDSGAISLWESRDEEGGVEVGLVLSKLEMDNFASIFAETLKALG